MTPKGSLYRFCVPKSLPFSGLQSLWVGTPPRPRVWLAQARRKWRLTAGLRKFGLLSRCAIYRPWLDRAKRKECYRWTHNPEPLEIGTPSRGVLAQGIRQTIRTGPVDKTFADSSNLHSTFARVWAATCVAWIESAPELIARWSIHNRQILLHAAWPFDADVEPCAVQPLPSGRTLSGFCSRGISPSWREP